MDFCACGKNINLLVGHMWQNAAIIHMKITITCYLRHKEVGNTVSSYNCMHLSNQNTAKRNYLRESTSVSITVDLVYNLGRKNNAARLGYK